MYISTIKRYKINKQKIENKIFVKYINISKHIWL